MTCKNPPENGGGEAENGRELSGRSRKRRRENVNTVVADRGHINNNGDAERGVQDAERLQGSARC